jgi:hypothetical protein
MFYKMKEYWENTMGRILTNPKIKYQKMKKKKERKKERETHTKVIWPMGWWVGLSLCPRARPISCLENPNPLANLYYLEQVKSAPQATCE